ncbi:MAG: ROK family protein [Acidimicrobiia bacterium]
MVAGIDIGGSGTKACVVADSRILATASVRTVSAAAESLGDVAVSVLGSALAEVGIGLADIDSIGLGVPGQVSDGVVRNAANLGIGEAGFDLGGYVSSATQVPAFVENDMRVAALGAYTQSVDIDPSIENLIYVGLGTGVSAGVILRGQVFRGSRGLAGEFGHVPMGTGLACACGSVGCLETVIGAAGLRQAWGGETGSALFGSAANGDVRARDLVDTTIDYLAQAMWWLAATYDPDIFFIGGGMAAATPSITALLADRWLEMAASSALARRVLDPDRIRLYDLEEPVGAYGAALLAAAHRDRSGQRQETANWEEEPIP